MKNLTLKKVALGLFLAGYAASSAFAAVSATTNATIKGHAPIIKSSKSGAADHTVDVTIKRSGAALAATDQVKIGDTIEVTYTLTDEDGDTEGSVFATAKTLVPYYFVSGAWVADTSNTSQTSASGKVSWDLPTSAMGATKIGFKILERTQFGDPSDGLWLMVGDVWSTSNPGTDPNEPTDPCDTGAAATCDNGGGGITPPGTGPVAGANEKLGIFKVNGATVDTSVNYAVTAVNLKYGETYEMIAFEDKAGSNLPTTATNVVTTANYTTYTWYLADGADNTPAIPAAPAVTTDVTTLTADFVLQTGTSTQIQLGGASAPAGGWNAAYSVTGAPKAGIQGFKLSAKAQ